MVRLSGKRHHPARGYETRKRRNGPICRSSEFEILPRINGKSWDLFGSLISGEK
jgi:hypothetical protein